MLCSLLNRTKWTIMDAFSLFLGTGKSHPLAGKVGPQGAKIPSRTRARAITRPSPDNGLIPPSERAKMAENSSGTMEDHTNWNINGTYLLDSTLQNFNRQPHQLWFGGSRFFENQSLDPQLQSVQRKGDGLIETPHGNIVRYLSTL